MRKTTCSKCGGPMEESRVGKYGYCKKCHAKNMRDNRPKWTPVYFEEKQKMRARSRSRDYVNKGYIVKERCVLCGKKDTEVHHRDYADPLNVLWVCKDCHAAIHKAHELIKIVNSKPAAPIIKGIKRRKRKSDGMPSDIQR